MSLRRTAPLTLVLAVVLLGTVASLAGAATPTSCERRAGTTIAQTPQWRVFKTIRASKSDPDAQIERVWSCVPGHRVARGLATFHSTLDLVIDTVGATIGGGRWIALELDFTGGVSETWGLKEYDLRTARFAAQVGFGESGGVPAYAITGAGGIAFVGDGGSVTGLDAAGTHTLAASGATDLAAAGSTVYWTAGGAPHAATLTGHAKGRTSVGS